MNAPERLALPDVQAHADQRDIAIQRVGVRSITHPMRVRTAAGEQPTVATVDMYVGLPAHVKGTHMSRFLELLDGFDAPLDCGTLRGLMQKMLVRLEADSGYIALRMPYFVRKTAPVSGVQSLLDYQLEMRAEAVDGRIAVSMQVVVPVTSLCPCSKNISEYGAHNQRSHVTIDAELAGDAAPERLIGVAEAAASCELWGLLKRPDEKWVTERAYDNPKFVEDLVRDVALALNAMPEVLAYTASSENFESIHNHSAYAQIRHDKRLAR